MMKKLFHGVLSLGLISAVFAAPSAAARSINNPPVKTTTAVHTADPLAGTILYDSNDARTGVIEGVVRLVVDQTGVTPGPIVYANFNLPIYFTWGGDEVVTVTSDEVDGGPVTSGWTATFSGTTVGISGLNLSDTDADSTVEFRISVATDETGITTTQEATGMYGVSSQYRTNSTRKVKQQAWVLSTPAMIDLTVTEAITWADNCPGGIGTCTTPNAGGASTYTTGSEIVTIPATAPEAAGYTFAGWWVDPTFSTGSPITGAYIPGAPYGPVTFYAKWI